MSDPERTRWTLIHGAAAGERAAREEFAQIYETIVRAYLKARWRSSPLAAELDDAVQDVFLDCFREDGALTRARFRREGGFRAFLHGVVRNVALRIERKRRRRRERQPGGVVELDEIGADEDSLTRVFDRAWALALLREAGELLAERAAIGTDAERRRVELLQLRFVDDLPIREIALRWDQPAERVHYHYKRARQEFRSALEEVVRQHDPTGTVEEETARLMTLVR